MKFNQTNSFPTDNRLRDDIGLPPIGEPPPPLQLIPYASVYFPNDDRLRDDIGLPPLGAALNVDSAERRRPRQPRELRALALPSLGSSTAA